MVQTKALKKCRFHNQMTASKLHIIQPVRLFAFDTTGVRQMNARLRT